MSDASKVGLVFTGHYDEAPAHDGAVKPGHLLTKLSTGKVDGHSSSGGAVNPIMVAFEDGLRGDRDVFDAYAADDIVPYGVPQRGDIIQMWLPAAATAVVVGSLLMSNGDGNVALRTSTNVVIGTAEEAIDNSAGSDPVRIAVKIV